MRLALDIIELVCVVGYVYLNERSHTDHTDRLDKVEKDVAALSQIAQDIATVIDGVKGKP